MIEQFKLLGTARFSPLFITQFGGALNDNIFRQGLVLLFTFHLLHIGQLDTSTINNLCAVLFILPYFLFSSTAGQLADKYNKTLVAQWVKRAEIVIMLTAAIGFYFKLSALLLLCLFAMGMHSTFFGPVKYASLPNLLHKNELIKGNGLIEMGTSIAILLGMVLAGLLIAGSHANPFILSGVMLGIAIVGYMSSRYIPSQQHFSQAITIDWNMWRTTKHNLSSLYAQKPLWFAVIGTSWFWFYGATFINQLPTFAEKQLHGEPLVVTLLLTLFSIGIAVGSLLCDYFSHHHFVLKTVLWGALGFTLFTFDLSFSMQHLPDATTTLSVLHILQTPAYYHALFDLVMLGVSGGFFVVPLYAFVQAQAEESHRARVIATNNMVNALFMVASAVFAVVLLSILKLQLHQLYWVTGTLNVLVCTLLYIKLISPNNQLK